MDDLIAELRNASCWHSDQWSTVEAAAVEIERLRAENARLVKLLEKAGPQGKEIW